MGPRAAEPAAAASSRDAAAGAETRERERDDEDGACEGAPGGAATEGLPDSREAKRLVGWLVNIES